MITWRKELVFDCNNEENNPECSVCLILDQLDCKSKRNRMDMEQSQHTNEAAGGVSAVERVVRPRPGLYLCSRTSKYIEDKPCDEAFQITVITTDTRNCDDPKKIPANKGTDGDWYTCGTNHRVENGNITRDLGTHKEWAVELTDILSFVDKYGDCVISRNSNGFGEIEIYDDYRE